MDVSKSLIEETVETENPLFKNKPFHAEVANNGHSLHYFNETNKERIRSLCRECKTFDDYYKKFDEIDREATIEFISMHPISNTGLDLVELRKRLEEHEQKINELQAQQIKNHLD
jgi:predicted RNase H-like nuclease (RuvC/YqgF family)